MAVMRTALRFSSPTTRSQIRQVNTVSQYQKGGAIDTVLIQYSKKHGVQSVVLQNFPADAGFLNNSILISPPFPVP